MVVKIHNKYYELSNFINKHPGGTKILESCEGIDATAAFESYHAFSDMKKINKIMKYYECNNPPYTIDSFDVTFLSTGFYNVLKEKVKIYFEKTTTKATYQWLFYFTITFSTYIYTFMYSFLALCKLAKLFNIIATSGK